MARISAFKWSITRVAFLMMRRRTGEPSGGSLIAFRGAADEPKGIANGQGWRESEMTNQREAKGFVQDLQSSKLPTASERHHLGTEWIRVATCSPEVN